MLNENLGFDVVQFSVGQSPKDVLRLISRYAKVELHDKKKIVH